MMATLSSENIDWLREGHEIFELQVIGDAPRSQISVLENRGYFYFNNDFVIENLDWMISKVLESWSTLVQKTWLEEGN